MAYYDALIAKWATLTGTTAQKLAAINALTVSNVPNSNWHATPQQLWECINGPEFIALTVAQRMEVYAMLGIGFPLIGGATAPSIQLVQIFTQAACPTTYAALVNLAQTVAGTMLWYLSAGYTAPISLDDLASAGGLT